jgi:signal transduction histidine kinase
VLGKEWLVLMVPSDEHSRLHSTFGDETTRPEIPIHFDSTLLSPDMRRWQYEWDRAALCDTEGKVVAWANVGRDVTEKKALEEQFLRAQKLATIGKLAAGIAHDFNNLLTVIMGYSSALVSRLDPADPARRDLDEIRKVTVKGAELTNRLLAFGRTQSLRPEVLSPNNLIGDAEQMLHRLVGNDVRLTTHLDPLAGLVRLDSSSFHQVLMNLAVNARDAMPNGGELIIGTSNVRIDTGSQLFPGVPSGDYVLITVSDSGTGMSEEVRHHLFEPFFTTKEPGKGVGLGLSTVYGIVHQSGGQIFVDSETGRGTTVRILLHRVFREAAPSVTPDVR